MTAISNTLAQYSVTFGLQLLWGMINGLQLLVHLPLYNVTIPANAMLIFNELQLVVSFDYLEKIYPSYARDLGITQTPSLNSRFDRLGYEERNIIANTGSIVFFLAFVILKVIFALIVTLCRQKGCCK